MLPFLFQPPACFILLILAFIICVLGTMGLFTRSHRLNYLMVVTTIAIVLLWVAQAFGAMLAGWPMPAL